MKMKHFLYALSFLFMTGMMVSCGDEEPVKDPTEQGGDDPEIQKPDIQPANEEWSPARQQQYLEDVALEMNRKVRVEDFEHYINLANYIEDRYIDDYSWNNVEDWAEDILDGLMGDVIKKETETEKWGNYVYNYIHSYYKSTILASNFNGHWTARNGKWQYAEADDLQFIFTNKKGEQCVLKLTTSGKVVKAHLFDLDDRTGYDWHEEKEGSAVITEGGNTITMTYSSTSYKVEITATFDNNDMCIRFIEKYTFNSIDSANEAWDNLMDDIEDEEKAQYSKDGRVISYNGTSTWEGTSRSELREFMEYLKKDVDQWNEGGESSYTSNEYYDHTQYTIGVPEKIEVSLTENGKTLISSSIDIDLASITNEEFDLSKSTLAFVCTTKLDNGYFIKVENVKYTSTSTSVKATVQKNKETLMTVTFSSDLRNMPAKTLTDWYDMDDDEIEDILKNTNAENGAFAIDFLGKVQVKGTIKDLHGLIDDMESADDNDENEEAYKRAIQRANTRYEANVYYNGGKYKQAWLSLEPFKDYEWRGYDGRTYVEWGFEPIINFSNGASYSFDEYFTEDAFKDLIDALEDQEDTAEDMWD